MFGKPGRAKQPGGRAQGGDTIDEDDPEVRALMDQIRALAATVYEYQRTIDELEAHPKFAGVAPPELPRVSVPETMDGAGLPEGEPDDFNPGNELMVLQDGELKPITEVDTQAQVEYGEALLRLEPGDTAFLRELATGAAGKENRPRTQGRRLVEADSNPVRRGDRRRSGDVAAPDRPRSAARRTDRPRSTRGADEPRNPSRSAASRRTRTAQAPASSRRTTRRGDEEDEGPSRRTTRRGNEDEDEGPSRRTTRRGDEDEDEAPAPSRRTSRRGETERRRRSPRDSPPESRESPRDDDSRASAPRRGARHDDDDDEYMGWPDARQRSRGHEERKDRS